MCGILGIVGSPRPESLDAVELLRHRGPDGDGRWLGERAGLAMRRLAIIDLETGDQPVVERARRRRRGRQRRALQLPRAARRARGEGAHVFRGVGDVELVPHLYEEHGERFVERLRGMFAIALWDERARPAPARARPLRDQAALPRRRSRTGLAFSSELAPLLALGASSEPDAEAIADYLVLGYVPGDADGHPRRAEARSRRAARARGRADARGAVVAARAARAAARGDARGGGAPAPALGRAARGAPLRRARLVADRVARGGTSSTCRCARSPSASRMPRYDEREPAREIARAIGSQHEELIVETDVAEDLPTIAARLEQPCADPRRDPALVPLPRGRVRGEGRARRRRRRRGLRRLLALRVGPGRRPPRSARRRSRGCSPERGGRKNVVRRASKLLKHAGEARGVALPLVVRVDGRRRPRARLRAAVRGGAGRV